MRRRWSNGGWWLRGAVLSACLTAVACGDTSSGGGNNNGGYCEGEQDCPPGYDCVANVCELAGDGGVPDGAPEDPDILVDPETLDFGTVLLGVPVTETVTVRNIGGAELTILSVSVEQDGGGSEFLATPSGSLNHPLAPNESLDIDVVLTSADDVADTGRLTIVSTDPDESLVHVALTSELKGEASVATCVMEGADPFAPCVSSPEVIDFGDVDAGDTVLADVSVSNAGSGNAQLSVTDLYVTDSSGYGNLFSLSLVRLVPDPGSPGQYVEQPVNAFPTQPALLAPDDGAGGQEALRVRVSFEASIHGQYVPAEALIIESDDPLTPVKQIPILGHILCPADYWDIDGQPGCEYHCVYVGPVDDTCDGVDDDCDGILDNGCPSCGNGNLDAGEACDDGLDNGTYGHCLADCSAMGPYCGDSVTNGPETCDDGASNGTYGFCAADCMGPGPRCGDSLVNGTEECDDGNSDDTDACANDCTWNLVPVTCGAVGGDSNGLLGPITLGQSITINTDTGAITDESGPVVAAALSPPPSTTTTNPGVTVVTQPSVVGFAAPQLAVFHFDTLDIPAGATVTITGSRVPALLGTGAVVMGGTVNLGGSAGGSGSINSAGSAGLGGLGGWDGGAFVSGPGCVAGNGRAFGPGAGNEGGCGTGGGRGGDGSAGGGGGGGGGSCGGSGGAGGGHSAPGGTASAASTGSAGSGGAAGPGTPGSGGFACSAAPQGSMGGNPYSDATLPILVGGTGGSSGGFGALGGFGGWGVGADGTGYGGVGGQSGGGGGGGGGGGAILICSNHSVTLSGSLDVSGGSGGGGGSSDFAENGQTSMIGSSPIGGGGGAGRSGGGGGAGGGAGGAVLIVAPSVTLSPGCNLDAGGGVGGFAGFAFGGGFGGMGRNGGGQGGSGGSGGGGGAGGSGADGYVTVMTTSLQNGAVIDGLFTQLPLP